MRNRHAFGIAAFCLFAFATAFDDPAAVKAMIQKEMNGYVAAMKKKDVKTAEKIILANFSPEFKDIDVRGTSRNRQQTIQSLKDNVASLKSVESMTFEIISIKVTGDKATTSEHMVLNATIQGMGDATKTSKLKVDSVWAGTYVKKGSKWLCLVSKTVKEKVWIDGKLMG